MLFRQDEYGLSVWGETNYGTTRLDEGKFSPVRCELLQKGEECEVEVYVPESVARTLTECRLRLGIDCYMDEYPDWNNKFFPTYFNSEKNCYYGAFVSPEQKILGISSARAAYGTNLLYSHAVYDDGINVGHRIFTTEIILRKGRKEKEIRFNLRLKLCEDTDELFKFWEQICGMELLIPDKFTYERGEVPKWNKNGGKIEIRHARGRKFSVGEPLTEYGLYNVFGKNMSEVKLYVRRPLSEYLKKAGEYAERYAQKPATHCESWYGYFSAFLSLKHFPERDRSIRLQKEFDKFLSVMLNEKRDNLVPEAAPERLQNLSSLVSILADAYEACGREDYLETANALAARLMSGQAEDGSFRCRGVHYSCVIYPIKSLTELYEAQKNNPRYRIQNEKIRLSVDAAIDDLLSRGDDIGTEGEATFEDGMITCSALQLAYYSLIFGKRKEECLRTAEELMKKHRCLEKFLSCDCRERGATERFWETMYDVLIRKNAMTSPHGWTAWKIYAVYYLYLLTGKANYLTDMFDTLGACLQLSDFDRDRLNWAFISDDRLKARVFEPTEDGEGRLREHEIGKSYLPMISDWWRADTNRVSKGYAYVEDGIREGEYKGASCDNDVHEIFKCMEETVYGKAFIHELNDGMIAYQCRINGNTIETEAECRELIYFSAGEKEIKVGKEKFRIKKGLNFLML